MSEENSTLPSGDEPDPSVKKARVLLEEPRSLSAGTGMQWISTGFKIFKLNPMIWVLISITFIALMIVFSAIPMLSVISSVISPVLLAGFFLACRDMEQGKDLTLGHLFSGFKVETKNLLMLGVLYTAVSLVIAVLASLALTTGGVTSEALVDGKMTDAQAMALLSSAGGPLILALVLMIPLTMAYIFAPQLVVFHGMPAFEAMKLSYKASMKNIWPFLLFGTVAMLLSFASALTFGIGFIVLVPVLGGAMYVAYQQVFLTE